jgi:hypothetical protein
MAGDVTNTFTLPTLAVIYLAALIIVAIQHFAKVSFGALGFISWVVVIVGAIGFVLAIIFHVIGSRY